MSTTRRTVIGALAAAPLLAMAPRLATASSGYATVILSPHQDDETLRLSAYLTFMADRGDQVALITATDGAATSVGRRLGLSPAEVVRVRDREQEHAWSWLTDGRGTTPIRLGLPDGGATATAVHAAAVKALGAMTGKPEVYVAAYDPAGPYAYVPAAGAGDAHPDHVACLEAGRRLASDGVTVRYAVHPWRTDAQGTAVYDTTEGQFLRVQAAAAAYRTIGRRSVPEQFDHLLAARGRTVVTRR